MIPRSMQSIPATDLAALASTGLRLAAAFLLGGLIGAERQYHQRIAGFRTNVLVALGAAAAARLPLLEITAQILAPGQTELAARLAAGPAPEAALDRLVEQLSASPLVIHAAWHAHTAAGWG